MAWRLGICMSEGFLTHDHVGCLNVVQPKTGWLQPLLWTAVMKSFTARSFTACGTRPSIIMQQPADKGMRLNQSFSVHDSLWHCRIEFQKIQQTITSLTYGCFLNGGIPKNTTKMMILVGKPMVVGETHHLRKPPYLSIYLFHPKKSKWLKSHPTRPSSQTIARFATWRDSAGLEVSDNKTLTRKQVKQRFHWYIYMHCIRT